MNSRISCILIIFLLALPGVFAGVEIGEGGFLEKIEPVFEMLNFLLVVVAIFFVVNSFPKLPHLGATLRKSWKYVLVTALIFAIFEVVQVLKHFDIFQWHGLGDVLEFLIVISFITALYYMKTFFGEIESMMEKVRPRKR